jgi:serine/threonine protein kinase
VWWGMAHCSRAEVLTQQPYSMETDIWSLGSVMYQMCTLDVPFNGSSVEELKVRPRAIDARTVGGGRLPGHLAIASART